MAQVVELAQDTVTTEQIKVDYMHKVQRNQELEKQLAVLMVRNGQLQHRRNAELAKRLKVLRGEEYSEKQQAAWNYWSGFVMGAWIVIMIYNIAYILTEVL